MNETLKKKWIKALRSGKYKQAQESLFGGIWNDDEGTPTDDVGYCCLGVLCEIQKTPMKDDLFMVEVPWSTIGDTYADGLDEAVNDAVGDCDYQGATVLGGKVYIHLESTLPVYMQKELGLDKKVKRNGTYITLHDKLTWMNDNGKTFDEIADYLEKVKF